MANLKTGSSGSDVKKLQQALVAAGYDVGKTGADGVFGKNTAAAVKQYQKDNGLAVDGIAGKNTLGALYGSSTKPTNTKAATGSNTGTKTVNVSATNKAATKNASAAPATSTASDSSKKETPTTILGTAPFEYEDFQYDDFTYQDYTPSDVVNQANSMLQQHNSNKPGAYQSQWQDKIDEYLGKIENRDPFSYDFNSDALYQQYKDSYIQQGQMAMMDTMGQAAAMTGGYGNSYAQTVGQQAYNQQLNQLNDVMPELYQMAYNRYADEGQRLTDMYNMYMGQESQDYNRYQTDLGNWYNELQYLTNRYDSERDHDYKIYDSNRQQAYNEYSSNRELAYNDYTTNKNIAYNESEAEQDRLWEKYLADQADKQTAANLLASAGSYDRLKEIYGLTDEEVEQIKKANTPVASGGGSSTKTQTYKTPTEEQLKYFEKSIGTLGLAGAVENAAYMYSLDPSYLNWYGSQISGGDGATIDTTVTPTTNSDAVNSLYGTGGIVGKGVYDPIKNQYVSIK